MVRIVTKFHEYLLIHDVLLGLWQSDLIDCVIFGNSILVQSQDLADLKIRRMLRSALDTVIYNKTFLIPTLRCVFVSF